MYHSLAEVEGHTEVYMELEKQRGYNNMYNA